MIARLQVAAILFFIVNYCAGCDVDMAVYKVTVKFLWTEETFPKDYPLHRPKAQWSAVFGQSHNTSYKLYHVGEVARQTVRNFAQYGKLDALVQEGDDDASVYDQFSASAVGAGTGETSNMVFVDGVHSQVSLICRLIPSPDWFVGVDSLDLCVDNSWVDQITLDVKEYSTKELNDLARKELLVSLKLKDKKKGLPRRKVNLLEEFREFTTKSYMEQLKDLEEVPVGTPRSNVPDNNVVVVTRSPVTTTTEKEFDSELKNMDDVVLAVAHGKKLGLGKHLPRHFRSRLHHAVNKIQPDDCLVSEWSEWSPCSVTCGFGDKFRTRSILRQARGKGRDCPSLKDRTHCGNINSCAHIDYFEW
ncbi:spondin-1-like isoform X3 [Colias croceus]|uniref:spondin-1-like isoform X3 n=1 Tax=Colias crocea TaxID=72248 RepID=UPI001E27ECA8|nr:spondin-1-like isoform X3 [Colias croceus]